MKVKIATIEDVETKTSKAGRPYTLTSFQDADGTLYKNVYGKFTAGQEIDGDWVDSEWGPKFEVAKTQMSAGGAQRPARGGPEERESIEWQSSLKAAIEAVRDHTTFSGLPKTGADLEWYIKEIDKAAVHFKSVINRGKEELK